MASQGSGIRACDFQPACGPAGVRQQFGRPAGRVRRGAYFMKFRVAAFAAASLLGAVLATPAMADEEDAIDCSSTPFSFTGQGYYVDCQRHEGSPRKDGASGQAQLDVINVTSEERSMFLSMVSIRLTSNGLHM